MPETVVLLVLPSWHGLHTTNPPFCPACIFFLYMADILHAPPLLSYTLSLLSTYLPAPSLLPQTFFSLHSIPVWFIYLPCGSLCHGTVGCLVIAAFGCVLLGGLEDHIYTCTLLLLPACFYSPVPYLPLPFTAAMPVTTCLPQHLLAYLPT